MDMQCVCGHWSREHQLTVAGCRHKECSCKVFHYVGTVH